VEPFHFKPALVVLARLARGKAATVNNPAAEFDRLRALAQAGRVAEADAGLRALRRLAPTMVEVPALLAWIANARRDDAACAQWLEQAYALDPRQPSALSVETDWALRHGDIARAQRAARILSELAPRSADAQYNLAHVLRMAGDVDAAAATLDRALDLDPTHVPARLGRAWLRLDARVFDAAIVDFEELIRAQPQLIVAWLGAGAVRLRQYDGAGAERYLRQACALDEQSADAWRGLAEALELQGRGDESLRARERSLAHSGYDPAMWLDHAMALARAGEYERAAETAEDVAQQHPQNLLARWLAVQLMPVICRDDAALTAARARWRTGLEGLIALDVAEQPWRAPLIETLTSTPNFHRHYLDADLRDDQTRYGALLTRWSGQALPATPPPRGSGAAKKRVCFASAHLRAHTVARLFRGWIEHLDRERYDVVTAFLGAVPDDTTAAIARCAGRHLGPHYRWQDWHEALAHAELDALIWLDIGMDGLTQLLAPQRYAPWQAVAWGHPVTTGLASIDVFLSAALMEREGSAVDYTERLVALPNLGIRYASPPEMRGASRTVGSSDSAPHYVCAQSVFKLLPEHDTLFAEILARVPDSTLSLMPHPAASVRQRLAARMRPTFAAHGVDFDARVRALGYQSHAEFFARLREADIMLDSLGWSGGNTTLEALATDLPVVTLPGPAMRARHTYAMLRRMELDAELAATDRVSYIDIAVRLGRDSAFRGDCVRAIAERKHALYDDDAPVQALDALLARELA
jgi:predicted O-linked N-acetylglucosamine transferase (SPINDLY family)